MDLDFENLTGNSTFEPDTEYYIHRYLSTELPTFIIAIAASFTNALIIYMVYKFRVLRTRTYHYVVCWCICNLFATISLPSSFNLFGMLYHFSAELLCLWSETLFVFIFGNQIFVGILMLDWYIMTFSSQTSCALRCRKSQKTIIVSVWIVLLSHLLTTTTMCLQDISFPFSALVAFFSFAILLVFLMFIFVARSVKLKTSSVVVEKTKFELALVFSYFACWMPNMICILFYIFFRMEDMFLMHMTYMLGYVNPCVIFAIMYIYDPKFKASLFLLLNKKMEERPLADEEEQFY